MRKTVFWMAGLAMATVAVLLASGCIHASVGNMH